jgi:Mlc titration factor MtfA (ptsG expression regulator)
MSNEPDREDFAPQPFFEEWESYLHQNVAHFSLLDETEQNRLRADLSVLVAEKNWEGCRGLQITEEMQVTIAAQASLLLLHLEHDYFSRVSSILVYPSGFVIPFGLETGESEWTFAARGQAVYRGPVILAWDTALAEGRDPSTGQNLVIHEFAHQLDFLDGEFNGTPELADPSREERWGEVMLAEYTRLRRDLRRGRQTFLGDYASKDEGEFFAVASERFYTRPERLRHLHPELYDVLVEYYGVDPIRWFAKKPGAPEDQQRQ